MGGGVVQVHRLDRALWRGNLNCGCNQSMQANTGLSTHFKLKTLNFVAAWHTAALLVSVPCIRCVESVKDRGLVAISVILPNIALSEFISLSRC